MIPLKLERIGSEVVLVFDDAARQALNLEIGDTVYVQRSVEGVIAVGEHDPGHEARAARGRALLKRYKKTFASLESRSA